MNTLNPRNNGELGRARPAAIAAGLREAESAVAWGAIIAGGAAAAALSLILLILGTGLGLSAVSPWAQTGIKATTFGVSTILWVTVTQILAAGMGGFLAGRLRGALAGAHGDEVFFRDSAHGFLAWAVASLATAALLSSVIGSIVGGGAQLAAKVADSTVVSATDVQRADAVNYAMDSLLRPVPASPEVGRIFMHALQTGTLPAEDADYLTQRVAAQTGMAPAQAQARVTQVMARLQTRVHTAEAQALEAADKARKASSYAALWLFISLLIGAFVASLAAIWGGRERDR